MNSSTVPVGILSEQQIHRKRKLTWPTVLQNDRYSIIGSRLFVNKVQLNAFDVDRILLVTEMCQEKSEYRSSETDLFNVSCSFVQL